MKSGDRCPGCLGVMGVYRTVRNGSNAPVTRYLKCHRCGQTGKEIIPQELSRRKLVASCDRR